MGFANGVYLPLRRPESGRAFTVYAPASYFLPAVGKTGRVEPINFFRFTNKEIREGLANEGENAEKILVAFILISTGDTLCCRKDLNGVEVRNKTASLLAKFDVYGDAILVDACHAAELG